MPTSMTGATGSSFTPTSTGTLKRGGIQGEYIPKGQRAAQLANFTPEQQQLFQQSFAHVGPESYLSRLAGGDESLFNEIEAPALKQFSGLQGNLASRFSAGGGGRGAMGSRRSSGFQNTTNQYASDFAQQLQANRQGLQRQALMDLGNMTNMLLGQKPYNRYMYGKQQKEGFNWGGAGGGTLGAIGGFFAGGPMGAVQGAQLGYNVGSGLTGHKGSGEGSGFGNMDLSKFGNLFGGQGGGSNVMSNGGYNALPGLEDQFRTGQAFL